VKYETLLAFIFQLKRLICFSLAAQFIEPINV
jgi:hypothetical protein